MVSNKEKREKERREEWQEQIEQKHGRIVAYCHTNFGLRAIHMYTSEVLGEHRSTLK